MMNEETLFQSFSKLKGKISFKMKGVTKDKWQASTNALREVFQNLWIGLCHRHCIENIKVAIRKDRDTAEITDKKANKLLNQVIKVLKNSTSSTSMQVRLNSLTDEAFKHPVLKKRTDELKHITKTIRFSTV